MRFLRYGIITVHVFLFVVFPIAASQKKEPWRHVLAVLPFENKTGDVDLGYLSDGISEWIRADLEQSLYVDVIDGNLSRDTIKGKKSSFSKVSHIVDGSFERVKEKFVISVAMRDLRTGEIMGGTQAECEELNELPLFVDEMTADIKAWLSLTEEQINDDLDRDVGQITTCSLEAFRHYLEGRKFILKGLRERAVSSFRNALDIEPEFSLASWEMGMAFPPQSLHSYALKANALLKALESPDRLSTRALFRLKGDYHSMTRYRYALALEAYEELLVLYPEDMKGHHNLGLLYLDIEEWEKAASQFRIVVGAGEERPEPYLNLARAYINPGLYDEAQGVLESCLRKIGNDVNIYLTLALIHRFKGEYDLSLDVAEKAIFQYPGNASSYANRGDIYLYRGDLRKAEAEYRNLAMHEKTAFQDLGQYRLSELYFLRGRFKEARLLAAQNIEHSRERGNKGTMRDRLSFSASLDAISGHPQEALDKLDILWATTVEDEELEWQRFIAYRKGLVHAEIGQLDQALKEAKKLEGLIAQGLDKKKMRLYLHLMGVVELHRKNYRKAIELLEESLPMICIRSRLNMAVADSLASAYSGIGDLEGAREVYERMTTFPRGRLFYGDIFAKSYYHLGKIFETEGKPDNAIENYERFLEIREDADSEMAEVVDARVRLASLRDVNAN